MPDPEDFEATDHDENVPNGILGNAPQLPLDNLFRAESEVSPAPVPASTDQAASQP